MNLDDVKTAACGRWIEILIAVAGIGGEFLDGKNHPCPKCGGRDRFRLIDVDAGACYCNQCFREKNGDGLAAVAWSTGKDFATSLQLVGEYLGCADEKKYKAPPKPPVKTFATARDAVSDLERRHGPRANHWTYHAPDGTPACIIIRWDKPDGTKDIRPVSRVAGGWAQCGMPEPRLLYGLPEVAAAAVVYVTEGEKAADAARSIGLVATTSPHGSKSASKADWKPLAGKSVIVLPDNDAPGEKYAADVAAELAKLSPPAKVRIVNLPDIPEAGDIVDWVKSRDSAEPEDLRAEIERLVDRASVIAAPPSTGPRETTLVSAMELYVAQLECGKTDLIELGMPDLDYALGGGVEAGEMVIMAGRPSHGKSAVALQVAHHWTGRGRPGLIVSEEMSALALGKRSLQFITDVPQEHWATSMRDVKDDCEFYREKHATCIIVESCGTCDMAVAQIENAIEKHKIQFAVVDYAQLLRSPGKSRYEQVTNTSIALRQLVNRHKIVLLVLCQLNRDIESRNKFVPQMSDLKETGQLEQDADVILFLVWPHRINSEFPASEYQIFTAKNRNRAINQGQVNCRFMPSRQMVLPEQIKPPVNRHQEFDQFNNHTQDYV